MKLIEVKSSFNVAKSGKPTTLDTNFSSEMILDGKWDIALQNILTYNSIAKIDSISNSFKYHNGTIWEVIAIGPGSYIITELIDEIVRLMKTNNNYDTANDVNNSNLPPIELTNNWKAHF